MTDKPHSSKDEIVRLQAKLEELEDLSHALRLAAVDALVVGPDDDHKRILLLSGAYHRYRKLVENMDQGAATVMRNGEILFLNQSFAAFLGARTQDLFRQLLTRYIATADRDQFSALVAGRIRGGLEVEMLRIDGVSRRARFSVIDDLDQFTTLIVTDAGREEARETIAAIRKGEVDALVDEGGQLAVLNTLIPGALRLRAELTNTLLGMRESLESLKTSEALDERARTLVDSLDRDVARLSDCCSMWDRPSELT